MAVAPYRTVLVRILGISALAMLSGCIGNTAFDEINATEPVGPGFPTALFRNYAYLAKSFGTSAAPAGQAFDADAAISLTGADNTISGVANAYALKAIAAAKGDDVLPEPAPDGDADAENVRLELLRDLDDGRDKTPDEAARAQADYDCWVINRRVPSLAAAAQTCRRSVTVSLAKLERTLNPTPAPPVAETAPPSAPVASTAVSPPAPAPASTAMAVQPAFTTQFTVLFASRSAYLSPEGMAVVSQAIDAARIGRQPHIRIIGHSDMDENSRALALKRAKAVELALVESGARSDAISIASDREAKDRGAVISLEP
ncbi:MAG TPA: OmpA family protein [Rhizomicrobium sp.]|nr:OmpA family protein [Rhizomicrobium sp.]